MPGEIMKAKEAKEITLEVWKYLAEHPEIKDKRGLPKNIWKKIKGMMYYCPLCEIYVKGRCSGCPLYEKDNGCFEEESYYYRWRKAGKEEKEERKEAAERIVEKLEEWKVKEKAAQMPGVVNI